MADIALSVTAKRQTKESTEDVTPAINENPGSGFGKD
jgi:hypothetical protein